MKVSAEVRQTTAKIAAGVGVLTLLMVAVFLIVGRFDYTVLLGALLGALFAILNFFWMAMGVQRAVDSMDGVQVAPEEEPADGETPEEEEPIKKPLSPEATHAGRRMQASYFLRMVVLAGVAILAIKLPWFNGLAACLPLLFPRIVIFVMNLLEKKETTAA
ncbi:MAG: ATP synthase subunit I [Clostridia bacterium]|nr:ATP synthase subunit I [Clostridia bacterium]